MPLAFQPRNQQHHGGAMEPRMPPVARVSRFRRLLVRVSAAPERLLAGDRERDERSAAPEPAEVGSAGLDRMVLNFMEDAAERGPPPRGRCGNCCFNGSAANSDGSDDDDDEGFVFDFLPSVSGSGHSASSAAGDAVEALKGLVQSASKAERSLMADATRVAERCRGGKQQQKKKGDLRLAVADGLRALGHNAAVCRSRWDKSPSSSFPAGEHEYIDAMVESEDAAGLRLIVEVDFRSEFEVARPTKAYRAALQTLPAVFVGTPERLGRIVAVVAEAARQSLRKKGLSFPPWRKPEYMRAKWLSPHARCSSGLDKPQPAPSQDATPVSAASFTGEFELRFGGETEGHEDGGGGGVAQKITVVVSPWRPVEPEAAEKKRPVVIAGLASVL